MAIKLMSNTPSKQKKERSSREDWLREALNLLGEKGLKGITIDALCKRLQLTKGSFYWHFKGQSELLSAMAERYSGSHHDEMLEHFEKKGFNDREQLEELAKLYFDQFGRIDHAMRLWAETCEETRLAVLKSDQKNLDFLEQRLINIGLPANKTKLLAKFQYAIAIGIYSGRPTFNDKDAHELFDLSKQLTLTFLEEN